MQIMEMLLGHATVVLRERGTLEGLCSTTVRPGTMVPFDFGTSECGGMMWAQMTSANPSQAFPDPDLTARSCTYDLAYVIDLGIIRPAKVPEESRSARGQIKLPTDQDASREAAQQLDDMDAMHQAIRRLHGELENLILGDYQPAGPEGGTVGGVWTLYVSGEDDD